MVVAVEKINPARYRDINLVADMRNAEIIKDKKAEKLIAEMKSASSIDQVKSMANAVSAVSYTHLDVYKRQLQSY